MSSSTIAGEPQCCDGSFSYAFQGPVKGFVPLLLTVFSCAPVILLMWKIYNGSQHFDGFDHDARRRRDDGDDNAHHDDLELQEREHHPQPHQVHGSSVAAPVLVASTTNSQEDAYDNTHNSTTTSTSISNEGEEEKREEVEEHIRNDKIVVVPKPLSLSQQKPQQNPQQQLPPKLRNQLLLSGMAKLTTRMYACLYASAAAGSAHACDPHESSVVNVCLNAGFGYEAFVLGYSGIAAGILDWMTLVGRPTLPLEKSLSAIRWQVINTKRCVMCENLVLAVLLVLLAIVGAGGHIFSARDSSGTILAVLVGIVVVIGAIIIICCLTPFVLCAIGVCGSFRDEGDEGDVMARSWEAVRVVFLEVPGISIGFFGNPAALVGWIIDIMDSGTDFILDHCAGE